MAWMITKDRRRSGLSLEGFGSFDVEVKFGDCPERFTIENKDGIVLIEGVATEQTTEMVVPVMCHIGKAKLRFLPKAMERAA